MTPGNPFNFIDLIALSGLEVKNIFSQGGLEMFFYNKKMLVLLFIVFSKSCFSSWQSFRGGFQNTGRSHVAISEFYGRQNTAVEKFQTNGLIWGSAVEDEEGNFYVGSADKYFYAFNAQFQLLWSFKLYDKADSLVDSAATVTSTGLVVVPGGDGYLHALDKKTGEKRWEFKASDASDDSHSSGVIVNSFEGNVTEGPNGLIYAGNDNGHMYCLDQNGNLVWSIKTNMMIWSMAAFDQENKWMVFGSLDKNLYLVEPLTGKIFDKIKLSGEIKASPSVDANQIYVGDSQGKVYKILIEAKKNGFKLKKEWCFSAKGEIYSSSANKNNQIVVGSLDGNLYSLNSQGQLIWKFNAYSPISSSPVISRDNLVVFGARNGKMYVLDYKTGKRIYSYTTSDKTAKVNLDASPLLASNGSIINGSYSGLIHKIPVELCNGSNSPRCEFNGNLDLPEYARNLSDGIHFIIQNSAGNFEKLQDYKYRYPSVLKLKMIKIKNGFYENFSAINSLSLNINSKDFKVYLSSDDEIINLMPLRPLSGKSLDLKVTGEIYQKQHWLWDRFKFFGLEKFKNNLMINIEQSSSSNFLEELITHKKSIFVDSLYLYQPKSLDTYIPAALDGQAFKIDFYEFNQNENKVKAIVTPATLTLSGPQVMMEPSKVFMLEGQVNDGSLSLTGKFKISAMGGTIPFELARFSLQFDHEKFFNQEFFMIAKCLKLQGNGASYSFSPTLIMETCDSSLRLIAAGRFDTLVYNEEQNVDYNFTTTRQDVKLNIRLKPTQSVVLSSIESGKLKTIKVDSQSQYFVFRNNSDLKVFINGVIVFGE
jgi:outer membrane protein assembly factor BamB